MRTPVTSPWSTAAVSSSTTPPPKRSACFKLQGLPLSCKALPEGSRSMKAMPGGADPLWIGRIIAGQHGAPLQAWQAQLPRVEHGPARGPSRILLEFEQGLARNDA